MVPRLEEGCLEAEGDADEPYDEICQGQVGYEVVKDGLHWSAGAHVDVDDHRVAQDCHQGKGTIEHRENDDYFFGRLIEWCPGIVGIYY